MKHMRNFTKETWQMIRRNLGSIVLFQLFFRGITAPVYLRFADRGIRLALQMTGDSYLTAGNIGTFLLHPGTLAVLLVLGAAGILLMLFETAGLLTAFQGSACDQKLTPFSVFKGALDKLRGGISRGIWRLALPVLAGTLWINLLLLARIFTHVRPVNFVLKEISGSPALALAVAGSLLVGLALTLPLAFLPFGYLVEQSSCQESGAASRRLMGAHGPGVLLLLTAGILLAALWTAVTYVAAVSVTAVLVTLLEERRLAMAVMLLAADRIEQILLLAGSAASTVICLGILAAFYFREHVPLSAPHFGDAFSGCPAYPKRASDAFCGSGGVDESRLLQEQKASKAHRIRVSWVVALVILFYLLDLVQNRFAISGDLMKSTQITAHRGSSRSAPENTLAALRAAEEELADYAEIDVQMTADGVVVLGHDASLRRVAGIDRAIGSMDWEELSRLDVGSWFSPAYGGERIPALAEVLEFSLGRLRLNIEMKDAGAASTLPEQVVELIQTYGYGEQCVITSTNLGYLARVKELAPELKTGYVIAAAYGDYYSMDVVDFISIRHTFVNPALVEKLHSQGKEVHVWTVNNRTDMERLRVLGVDNLITDDPILAREIIYQEEATENLMEYLRAVLGT